MKKSKTTICSECGTEFEIHLNRSYKIRINTNLLWFVDAMNQFENFSEVTCPNCNNNFKAQEAKLFGIFKSPYTVMIIGVLFVLFLIGINFLIQM
jgi:uncharacterized Zn-finger protein